MNTNDPAAGESASLGQLIARLSDGSLSDDDAARLNAMLRHDPSAQEACLDHLAVDAMLEREFGGVAVPWRDCAKTVENSSGAHFTRSEAKPGGAWRGAMAQLAAGLVLGFFLASAVWAYAVPLLDAARAKLLPLANGDFESATSPPPDGVPTRDGVWSGDFVEITGPQQAVVPHSGGKMLRFLRADDAHTPANAPVRAAELWQVLDLRKVRATLGVGIATIQFGGWFNAAAHPGRRYTCGVAVVALRGEAADMPALWRHRHQVSLAEADKEERLDDDPETWQFVEAQVAVPPDADLLLVQARVYDKSAGPSEGPSIFSAHFADDFSLRVIGPASDRAYPLQFRSL